MKKTTASKKENFVWIVEWLLGRTWKPTITAAVTKRSAEVKQGTWMKKNPNDFFRVTKYTRATK